jgi:hypothetical protein
MPRYHVHLFKDKASRAFVGSENEHSRAALPH